jgi:acyl-CoA thioesterase
MKSLAHPFADLVDFTVDHQSAGHSTLSLRVAAKHMNPHHVVHGAVLYALADTGMGAALYPTLAPGEICATIEVKINYFKPVARGVVVCETELLNRGKSVANLDSRLFVDGTLVAQANGHYAIIKARPAV